MLWKRKYAPAAIRRGRGLDPLLASGQDHVVALERLGVEPRDLLGRILQVAVEHPHPAAPAGREPGRDRRVLAEVATQAQTDHTVVERAQLLNHRPAVIGAAVVDQDQLEVVGQRLDRGRDPALELPQALATAIDWNDHADLDRAPSGWLTVHPTRRAHRPERTSRGGAHRQ